MTMHRLNVAVLFRKELLGYHQLVSVCFASLTGRPRRSSRDPDLYAPNKKISHLTVTGRANEARDACDRTECRNNVSWNSMINGYVKRGEITKARKLFDQMSERNVVSWNMLISGYVSCGGYKFLKEGRHLFDRMPERDCVSWNTMISGYAKNGRMDEALELFNRMPERNVVSWNAMVTGFLKNGDVASAIEFFERMPKRDGASFNALVSGLIKNGELDEAARVLLECGECDGGNGDYIVSWNSTISGYVKRREMSKARTLFDRMSERDVVSWNLMISGYVSCGGDRFLEEGRYLFERMPTRDCFSWNTMISGYTKNGRMDEALELFKRMPEKDVVSWNAMVSGFLQNGDVACGVEFYKRTPKRDGASFIALVSGLIQNGKFDEAERVLLESWNSDGGNGDLVHGYNTLIAGYGQIGRLAEARKLFDKIPCDNDGGKESHGGFRRDVVSWNTMIMCYVKAGHIGSARELFDQIKERDTFSWNTMISGYVHMSDMEKASDLFHKMPNPDTLSWNSMISGYAKEGKLNLARNFFERMPQRNLVSWNSLIVGYEKNEDYNGAIKLLIQMQLEGEKPDHHTLSSVLSSSTRIVDLYLGMQIHQLVTKTVIPNVPVNNALIAMYSRCGAIVEARTIFDEMELQKDVISWNATIGGYASHGYASEALELFEVMKSSDVQPTYVTFISVLKACSHTGLVQKCLEIFKSMVEDYGIAPGVEHYASLIETLGHHGQLESALDLVNGMPFEPDKFFWDALLVASRVHNNVQMERIAGEALMRLEPES